MAIPTGLQGTYTLSPLAIDNNVRDSIGAYALGDVIDADRALTIRYVGRSDYSLNSRLKDHLGKYTYFQFAHFGSAQACYEAECRLYHTFGGPNGLLDNKIHPAAPNGRTRCPQCGA